MFYFTGGAKSALPVAVRFLCSRQARNRSAVSCGRAKRRKRFRAQERTAFANGAGPLREDDGEVDENLT